MSWLICRICGHGFGVVGTKIYACLCPKSYERMVESTFQPDSEEVMKRKIREASAVNSCW